MPAVGANIVGPSSEFNQTDWLVTSPAFLSGKKNLYVSWYSKSDVSGTDNVPLATGQITKSTPLYFRHGNTNVVAPPCWAWGYIYTDRSVRFESGTGTGSNNKLQRVACQIRSGAAPQMWIDGVALTPNNITQDPTGTGYPTGGLLIQALDELWVGRGGVNSRLWDGLVDEVRIIEDIKDTNYALTEFRNLANIDQMVTFGDVETPSSALSPRGELVIAEVTPGSTTRIKVDTFLVNPNPTSAVISNVSAPTVGTAVKVDDANVDYIAGPTVGTTSFNVTFTSSGKSIVVPVRVNISGTVSVRPPDITTMALLTDRVTWDYIEPAGFEGYQPREGDDAATWATATNVGAKTSNKYVMKSGLLVPSKKVLVKPYANSLEALNAAEISLTAPPPPPPGEYYSSPNYGTKTREDVGGREALNNAIANIKTDQAYINMTYVDNSTLTINRGGTLAHPLIITAQAPNGLTNFSGRAGFTNTVTMAANYVWLDRLKFSTSGDVKAIVIKNAWKFVTRCQINSHQGVSLFEGDFGQEWWVGFNEFIGGNYTVKSAGLIDIGVGGAGTGKPVKGRVYYNILKDLGTAGETVGYAVIIEPGAKLGSPDQDYGGYNLDESWFHYNYVSVENRWGVYMKHPFSDVAYNHVIKSKLHGISTRGECASRTKFRFNRVTSEQMSMQGWHYELIGNIATAGGGILLGCEFRNGKDTPKFTRGGMFAKAIGNQGELCLGECRDLDTPIMYAPLHDVQIEAHNGKFTRWVNDSTRTEIKPDANNKLPESPQFKGMQLYDNDRITIKNTTSVKLETPPILNETICGPGSTRGKAWGT